MQHKYSLGLECGSGRDTVVYIIERVAGYRLNDGMESRSKKKFFKPVQLKESNGARGSKSGVRGAMNK